MFGQGFQVNQESSWHGFEKPCYLKVKQTQIEIIAIYEIKWSQVMARAQ